MPLHTWWTFVIATFFVSATPGPNMLHVMSSGIRHGLRMSFFTMGGLMTAVLSITTASAAGMGTVLAESPHAYDVLRLLGAAYLIYLGVKTAWLPVSTPIDAQTTTDIPDTATPLSHFRGGFLVGISNPKLLLFATAFFPQFIDKVGPELPQFLILLATFFCIELGWYLAYAMGGSRIAGYMQREGVQRAFNRVTGGLFAVFGLLLLRFRHA